MPMNAIAAGRTENRTRVVLLPLPLPLLMLLGGASRGGNGQNERGIHANSQAGLKTSAFNLHKLQVAIYHSVWGFKFN